jgi:hypothetical protein
MTWTILAAAPFVVGLALICGFALGRRLPRTADYFSSKDAAELQRRAWEQHWAANREAEDAAALAELSSAPDGDLTVKRMNVAHTHVEH